MNDPRFIPLRHTRVPDADVVERARAFYASMKTRRTTRHFSSDAVPREAIELAIRTAGSAPSGAHQQPWTFVAVSDPAIKAGIREAAEREEYLNYHGRMPEEWLQALAPLGTDETKAHLTDAPWLVVLFRKSHGVEPDGTRRPYYYTQESVGIAAGFFIAAVFLVVGCFLDAIPAIVIVGTVLEPLAKSVGMDPIHFAMIGIVSLAFGLVTPPYGLCLMISAHIAGIRLMDALKDVFIMLLPMFAVLALIIMWPQLVLFLPRLFPPGTL